MIRRAVAGSMRTLRMESLASCEALTTGCHWAAAAGDSRKRGGGLTLRRPARAERSFRSGLDLDDLAGLDDCLGLDCGRRTQLG
jgi:hypothetical protein